MKTPPQNLLKQNHMILIFLIVVLLSTCSAHHPLAKPTIFPRSSSSSNIQFSQKPLILNDNLSFENIHEAAKDFGNIYHFLPSAILYPETVSDISTIIININEMGTTSGLTVAARGNGHSLKGQAQAYHGIVIDMKSLRGPEMQFYTGELPYVDVSGGELWINILNESLKHGLSPKSWTDYLHLTVGGTLSNAGVSGQAFRHGPQINNVYQLEVVTGTGEVVTCSETQNTDLFYGVLGGLGQFGIITRARISLEPAPIMVKWIRVLYSDFSIFTQDQEHLISSQKAFDYIEGFVIINRTDLVNSWRSTFNPKDPVQASQFISDGKTLFCLEMAKYFNPQEIDFMNQKVDGLLSELSYIESTLFLSEVSYVEFLDRVHVSMLKLQEKGLWDLPHPWLNLIIPRSRIHEFAQEVFGNIITDTSNGPILIYPVNKSKWNNRTSMITPEEDVLYLVAFLSSAMPGSTGTDGLEYIFSQNKRILDFCKSANLGMKQYLPHYLTQEEWKIHFGSKWEVFLRRKFTYDPLAILAPGQRIFKKGKVSQ
ncbi:unnamed protein product [Ilex paraguariensis]|uniref:cytokinin dehydrogenase n=1 Tax=Ilex paraguariensis TaxID=185542 RepID=A0ABC8US28_9AQUA